MKKYFKRLFDGRINKKTYNVGVSLILLLLFILMYLFAAFDFFGQNNLLETIIFLIIAFIGGFYFCSFEQRRRNDLGERPVFWSDGASIFKEGVKNENSHGKPPPPKIDIKGLFGF